VSLFPDLDLDCRECTVDALIETIPLEPSFREAWQHYQGEVVVGSAVVGGGGSGYLSPMMTRAFHIRDTCFNCRYSVSNDRFAHRNVVVNAGG
jgi:hypothetical protein